MRHKLSKYQRMMRVEREHLWQCFDQLLTPTVADVNAFVPNLSYDCQIAGIRDPTRRSPVHVRAHSSSDFFRSVIKLAQELPGKQCSSDPLPSLLLKTRMPLFWRLTAFLLFFSFTLQK